MGVDALGRRAHDTMDGSMAILYGEGFNPHSLSCQARITLRRNQ